MGCSFYNIYKFDLCKNSSAKSKLFFKNIQICHFYFYNFVWNLSYSILDDRNKILIFIYLCFGYKTKYILDIMMYWIQI